jgi:hypothetical protein
MAKTEAGSHPALKIARLVHVTPVRRKRELAFPRDDDSLDFYFPQDCAHPQALDKISRQFLDLHCIMPAGCDRQPAEIISCDFLGVQRVHLDEKIHSSMIRLELLPFGWEAIIGNVRSLQSISASVNRNALVLADSPISSCRRPSDQILDSQQFNVLLRGHQQQLTFFKQHSR